MVDHRRLAAQLVERLEDLTGEIGCVGCKGAAGKERDLAVRRGIMGLGLDMARQVGEVDTVDGAVGGEDVPFLVDFDTCIGVAGNEAELLVVVACVIYERGDVVMREAGVLAGGAEEAAAHRLRELFVGRELDSELVA